MRWVPVLLLVLKLTAPSGVDLYIPAQGIVGFGVHPGCATTTVFTMGQNFCVRETPDYINRQLQNGE